MSRTPFALGSPVSVRDTYKREAYTGEIVGIEGRIDDATPRVVTVLYAGLAKRFDVSSRAALDDSKIHFDIFR